MSLNHRGVRRCELREFALTSLSLDLPEHSNLTAEDKYSSVSSVKATSSGTDGRSGRGGEGTLVIASGPRLEVLLPHLDCLSCGFTAGFLVFRCTGKTIPDMGSSSLFNIS